MSATPTGKQPAKQSGSKRKPRRHRVRRKRTPTELDYLLNMAGQDDQHFIASMAVHNLRSTGLSDEEIEVLLFEAIKDGKMPGAMRGYVDDPSAYK